MCAVLCALGELISRDARPYRNLVPSFVSILKQARTPAAPDGLREMPARVLLRSESDCSPSARLRHHNPPPPPPALGRARAVVSGSRAVGRGWLQIAQETKRIIDTDSAAARCNHACNSRLISAEQCPNLAQPHVRAVPRPDWLIHLDCAVGDGGKAAQGVRLPQGPRTLHPGMPSSPGRASACGWLGSWQAKLAPAALAMKPLTEGPRWAGLC